MDDFKVERLEKRIEVLSEWKSRMLELYGEELSPFDKWCLENELSREDQHFITNLSLLFSIHLHPEPDNSEVRNILHNTKAYFNVDHIELTFEEFDRFIKEYQRKEKPIFYWDTRELLEKLAQSNRSVQLKEWLIGQ
ncbi:hypothetical protein DNH61_17815 [Paenibacillus sambharensis]|uniref:Uncharacterized protein n=1 Tax=Paenibacillus sambharensis TaxID=1803190 RepID=A0A2W1LGU7_9BACL|nr:hypothetical protein [Paenibacillus sambharensis]PZD94272.1 hypothetical protein DNH61_17815 [Paenibacillus sambharensis]